MKDVKAFTIRVETDLMKKAKIKAILKDVTVNEYIATLIADDVADVDLSGVVKE